MISATEANQNFSRATGIEDAHGESVVFEKTNRSICLREMESGRHVDRTDDEKTGVITAHILRQDKAACKELAK